MLVAPVNPEPCREQRRRTADQGLLSCAGNRGVRRSFQLTALEIQQLPVVLNSARDYLAVCTRRIALGHILYVYMLGTPLKFNAYKAYV